MPAEPVSGNGGWSARRFGSVGLLFLALFCGPAQAVAQVCGNGIPEGVEQCDDGNTLPGDCCSPLCDFEVAGTECRAASDICDVAETCSGSSGSCPADAFQPSSLACRPGQGGGCDKWEYCTGSDPACPPDGFQPATTVCRLAFAECDAVELCPGTSRFCPPNSSLPDTTECRPQNGPCDVAEFCSGSGVFCPGDAFEPDDTPCPDGLFCNGAETCLAGGCVAGTQPLCGDELECTIDSCDEGLGCVNEAQEMCVEAIPALPGWALASLALGLGAAARRRLAAAR